MHLKSLKNLRVFVFQFQNYPKGYEKLVVYYFDTAEYNEKFVVSSGIQARIFRFLESLFLQITQGTLLLYLLIIYLNKKYTF